MIQKNIINETKINNECKPIINEDEVKKKEEIEIYKIGEKISKTDKLLFIVFKVLKN
jgi:F420-0:gamma-glutamyl ligase-like protein